MFIMYFYVCIFCICIIKYIVLIFSDLCTHMHIDIYTCIIDDTVIIRYTSQGSLADKVTGAMGSTLKRVFPLDRAHL